MTLPDDERRLEAAAKALLAASWPGSLSYDKRDPEDQRHCREAMAKAIAAYENEPEPTVPQLLIDIAQAIANTPDTNGDHRLDEARAALGVVAKKYAEQEWSRQQLAVEAFSEWSDIPESMVRGMLDD